MKEKLNELDNILINLEDITHGNIGEEVTKARGILLEIISNQVEAQVGLQGEPLPCPFCKTLPEKYQVGDRPSRGEKGTTYVRCLNNNCAIWREPIMLTKWNKRAGREPQSK